MAKVKILCPNIYLNGRKCLRAQVEVIDDKLAKEILDGDKLAGRKPRIEIIKPATRRKVTKNGSS